MKTASIAITFVWVGLLLGLAFIETPLKFQAPGITKALALGIGKLVFATLNKIEWGMLITLVAVLWRLKSTNLSTKISAKLPGALLGLLIAIVAVQTFYLLPILNDRVTQIQNGIEPPASSTHVVYVVADVVKLIALIALGIAFSRMKVSAKGEAELAS
jgi:hypothetical protein